MLILEKVIAFRYCILFFIMEFSVKNSIKFLDCILFFTTDEWTSRAIESYLSLTIHYITSDFNMHYFMLNLHQVKQSHTTENIKKHITGMLKYLEVLPR